ncbi:AEC family transporter [Oscillospiraceae bacterium PP1C4]
MTFVLIKAFAFVFAIFLGYLLKRVGFFAPDDYKLISKIMLNVTLPASLITSFIDFDMELSLLLIILLGLGTNLLMIFWGYLASRKKDRAAKAFYILNFSGYNIGSFSMPFVQSFFGPFAVVVASMFNTGNSIMTTGGTCAVVAGVSGADQRSSVKEVMKTLFSSVSFDTCILLLIFALTGVQLPAAIISIASLIGAANGFLAMLAIGMMFEIKFDSNYFGQVAHTLFARYLSSALFALLFYFCLPFSLEIRQVLVLVVFSPISALAPAFTEKSKGDSALSSFASSLSIAISVTIMIVLLLVMQIS